MKIRILLSAAVLALLLCACHKEPQPVPTDFPELTPVTVDSPEPTPVAVEPPEAIEEPETHELPLDITPVPHELPAIEPVTVALAVTDGCFDEVCSYCLVRPVLNDGKAYPGINHFYEKLEEAVLTHLGGTVYDAALSRSCVADAASDCTWEDDGETFSVTYTLTVTYSDSDTPEVSTRTDRFDLRNDEPMEELP